jgi:CSLREA domain-containing protein
MNLCGDLQGGWRMAQSRQDGGMLPNPGTSVPIRGATGQGSLSPTAESRSRLAKEVLMCACALGLLRIRSTTGRSSCAAGVVVVLAALSCAITARSADAGINVWTSGGPAGEYIKSLAVDPTTPHTLYAGGRDVFRSTDGGASWQPSSSGLPAQPVSVLTIDPLAPGTLYAGTDSGVLKSTDSGVTWQLMNTGLTYRRVAALTIDPYTASTLYVATFDCSELSCQGDLFKSTDGAESWHPSSSGLPADPFVDNLAFDLLTPETLFADTTRGIFTSTDGGGSWSLRSTEAGFLAFAIDPHTPSILYAGVAGAGVIKSTDAGNTWDSISPGSGYTVADAVAVDPNTPATLYAAIIYGGSGVLKSSDGGRSWIDTRFVNTNGLNALAIASTTPSTVYVATYNGVFAIQMATFTVNSADDAPDAMPGDGVCAAGGGACTLRAAIDEANALAGGSTIGSACRYLPPHARRCRDQRRSDPQGGGSRAHAR